MKRAGSALRWVSLLVVGIAMFVAGAILGRNYGYLVIVLFVVGFIALVLLTQWRRQRPVSGQFDASHYPPPWKEPVE